MGKPPSRVHARGQAWVRWVASVLFSVLFAAQVGMTLINRNLWPFCSYNMFSHTVRGQYQRIVVTLTEGDGREVSVSPANTVAIEFFRANRAYYEVFGREVEDFRRRAFCEMILRDLRKTEWIRGNEVRPQARSVTRSGFVGLDAFLERSSQQWDLSTQGVERMQLYSYQQHERP
jgi:hypothetical protein